MESDSDTDDSIPWIMTTGQRQVEVDKVSIPMEVDTGASVSIISENQYHKLWPMPLVP